MYNLTQVINVSFLISILTGYLIGKIEVMRHCVHWTGVSQFFFDPSRSRHTIMVF